MRAACLLFIALSFAGIAISAENNAGSTRHWSPTNAAKYLDSRQIWWQSWPKSQRDHATVCVSCHTALPYSLGRRALRRDLGETAPTPAERFLLDGVIKRVSLWSGVAPFYTDAKNGPPKSAESRGTEAVLNALILANHDAQRGRLSQISRAAFRNMWALQLKSGPTAGAWDWLNFHLAPWESKDAQYYGAALAAVAVGTAPEGYSADPSIQEQLQLLRAYLIGNFDAQPLFNQVVLLWASAKLAVLAPDKRASLLDSLYARQLSDGGWNLAALSPWKRSDSTQEPNESDGYATAITVFTLEEAGISSSEIHVRRGLMWLDQHQDKDQGLWPAYSLNKERDPSTDTGKFMSDAATGFAVLALEQDR